MLAPGARRPVISSPRERHYRVGASFWGSLAFHLLLLVLCALFVRFGPMPGTLPAHRRAPEPVRYFSLSWPGGATGEPVPAPAAPAGQAVSPTTAAIPSAAPQQTDKRDQELHFPTRVPRGVSPATPGAGAAQPTAGAPAPGRGAQAGSGAGGRGDLHTGFSDPRLYVDPSTIIGPDPKQTDIERYRAHLKARIEALNDSSYAAGSHPNTDWTVKGKDGSSWGIASDGIHLGKVTIPRALIPIPSTGSAAGAQEAAKKAEQGAEIRRQEEVGEIRREQKERIKAIRERKDAEHQKTEAPKDTTKSGGR